MSWKKLTQKEKELICNYGNLDIGKLNNLIQAYSFVDYNKVDRGCPMMYALRSGNYRLLYRNPDFDSVKSGYGRENIHKLIEYPMMDHSRAFRTSDKKMYYLTATYLPASEIDKIMHMVKTEDLKGLAPGANWSFKGFYGDYSDLKYEILSDDMCYYDGTRHVLFYV